MKIDLYTRTVLTVIAVCLAVIACRPLAASPARASVDAHLVEQLASIQRHVRGISRGEYPCVNKHLCP